MTMNKVFLLGRAGSDPDTRIMSGGRKEARLTLGTGKPAKGWHRVILFDRLAQVAEDHVSKNDRVLVVGHIEYRSYERDGIEIPTVEIIARELTLLETSPAVHAGCRYCKGYRDAVEDFEHDMPTSPSCDCERRSA